MLLLFAKITAGDSHQISYLICNFLKIRKDVAKIMSAADVIGALRVKHFI